MYLNIVFFLSIFLSEERKEENRKLKNGVYKTMLQCKPWNSGIVHSKGVLAIAMDIFSQTWIGGETGYT